MPSSCTLRLTLPLTTVQLSSLSLPSKAYSSVSKALSPLTSHPPCSPSTSLTPKVIHFPFSPPPSPPFAYPSPSPRAIQQATKPRVPLSWTWKCHLCHAIYKLSTTRRCLLDGHVLCFAPPLPNISASNRRGLSAAAAAS